VTERRPFPLALPRSLPARLGLGAAIGYAALVGITGVAYRTFLYPAPKAGLEPQVKGTSLWRLPSERGEVIALFAAPAADKPVIAFFHGNGEELVDTSPLARQLVGAGFGILFVEYPGYGMAQGQKTDEHAIYDAAERALRELDDRGYGADRVVLVGQSLGSGVATEMALRSKGGRLVLISPYTSIPDMVRRFVPFLPVGWIVRDRFDTLEKAASIRVPTLVAHGEEDRLIPIDMGRRVSAAISGARLEIIERAGHNDMWSNGRLFDLLTEFSGSGRAGTRAGAGSAPGPAADASGRAAN
jgi:pimeloyl-ACP methyl ester carboxylesterase